MTMLFYGGFCLVLLSRTYLANRDSDRESERRFWSSSSASSSFLPFQSDVPVGRDTSGHVKGQGYWQSFRRYLAPLFFSPSVHIRFHASPSSHARLSLSLSTPLSHGSELNFLCSRSGKKKRKKEREEKKERKKMPLLQRYIVPLWKTTPLPRMISKARRFPLLSSHLLYSLVSSSFSPLFQSFRITRTKEGEFPLCLSLFFSTSQPREWKKNPLIES